MHWWASSWRYAMGDCSLHGESSTLVCLNLMITRLHNSIHYVLFGVSIANLETRLQLNIM